MRRACSRHDKQVFFPHYKVVVQLGIPMAIETDDGQVIREADHVAALIEGNADTNFMGVTKVLSARLPMVQVAEIEAIAEKSGKTRNAMLSMLLSVGIEEVRAGLKTKTLKEINANMNQKISEEIEQMQGGE